MNKQEYNIQDITEYLLGALPEIEAERFDELSFSDEEFAGALSSVEKDLVDAYIRGELTGATLERFKSHYLASPLRREKVEFAGAFQDFAKNDLLKKSENFAARETKAKRSAAGFFARLNIFSNQNPFWQWGFAAAALAFVVLGGLWIVSNRLGEENRIATQVTPATTNQEVPKPIEERRSENTNAEREVAASVDGNATPQQNSEKEQTKKQPVPAPARTPKQQPSLQPTIASIFLVPSLRGNTGITNLFVTEKTTDVAVRLQLESNDYAAYRVVLTDDAGSRNFWRSGTLKTKSKRNDKTLPFRFPAKLLKTGIYSLTLLGVNSNGEAEIIGNYAFRCVVK